MAPEFHFLADVHLPLSPGPRTSLFLDYLRVCDPRRVERVFLLGDVFHYWVHRSSTIRTAYRDVLNQIRRTAERGVRIHFFPGNRDFLFYRSIGRRLGDAVEFHGQPLVVELGPRRVHMSHGDELCVNDRRYMLWRGFVRHPATLLVFDRLPESWRDRLVERLSRASRRMSNQQPLEIPPQVYQRIFGRGANVIVHGHTHISGHVASEGPPGEVWVLPDWEKEPSVLVYDEDADRFELRSIAEFFS